MEPLIGLTVVNRQPYFRPGDRLVSEYQLDAVDPEEVAAVEVSVLWYTEGKGDEDLAVHYFERRTPDDAEDANLCLLHRFETHLPKSPLSYDGRIVKLRWCVRVRVFLRHGKEVFFDRPFRIGDGRQPPLETEVKSSEA